MWAAGHGVSPRWAVDSPGMATLRERVADRDAESFVGRGAELDVFERVLGGDDRARVVFVHGPGGMGKSTLLREVVRRARRRGYGAIWVDGREVAPFPQQIESMVAEITDARPAIVVFDSYELIASLDGSLRDVIVPDLPDATVVVFASRQPPARGAYSDGRRSGTAAGLARAGDAVHDGRGLP